MTDESQEREVWDESLAHKLLDRRVLVGFTWLDADGKLLEQEQVFGRVVGVIARKGFELSLEGGRVGEMCSGGTYLLPPDTRAFRAAIPGSYRLRSTGEIVVDPDFTASFTGTRPSRQPGL